jgi:hypothetical protein
MNAKTGTTKVGGKDTEAKAKKERKPRTKRPAFDLSKAKAGKAGIKLDDNGRLTAVPTNFEPSYAPLRRSAFTDKATYYEFKATLVDGKIEKLEESKVEWLEKAEECRKGIDPLEKKKRKLTRMKKQMAELEKQLEAEGIEV